jgi:hypothetical protein
MNTEIEKEYGILGYNPKRIKILMARYSVGESKI